MIALSFAPLFAPLFPLTAACAPVSESVTIVEAKTGETPLIVTGTVFRPDGTTPAAGVTLYVYQTGADGTYGGPPPTLRGWMETGPDGGYSYRTIRPAPYPNSTIASHVHTQLWGPDVPAQWGTDLLFADDPLVRADERTRSAGLGRFAFVCEPTAAADGARRCVHDLRLKTAGDTFEPSTRHGLDRR